LNPLAVISFAGVVGDAPPVYTPVELPPSPTLLNKSNFTATLWLIPVYAGKVGESGPYPNPPPLGPFAVVPLFWMTNAIPSAFASAGCRLNSGVNPPNFTAVV